MGLGLGQGSSQQMSATGPSTWLDRRHKNSWASLPLKCPVGRDLMRELFLRCRPLPFVGPGDEGLGSPFSGIRKLTAAKGLTDEAPRGRFVGYGKAATEPWRTRTRCTWRRSTRRPRNEARPWSLRRLPAVKGLCRPHSGAGAASSYPLSVAAVPRHGLELDQCHPRRDAMARDGRFGHSDCSLERSGLFRGSFHRQLVSRWVILAAWVVGLDAGAINWTITARKAIVIGRVAGGYDHSHYRGYDASEVTVSCNQLTGETTVRWTRPPTTTGHAMSGGQHSPAA